MFGFLRTEFKLPLLLVVILCLVSYAIIILKYHKRKHKVKSEKLVLPCGNMGLPFLGETIEFLKPHVSNSMGSFLQQHCQRFGRVFKTHVFGSPAIVSCDMEFNMFILQNEEKIFQTSYPNVIHGILGKYSLLLVSGDLHKKLRHLAVNFINSSRTHPDFLRRVETFTISFIESWNGLHEIAFFKQAKTFTLSLMVNILLTVEPGEPRTKHILDDFETYMTGFVSLPIYVPGSAYYNAVKARERLSSTVKEMMEERRKSKAKGFQKGEGKENNVDFLDIVIAKENLIDDERVSIVLDILLGGYETTATLASLIVYFLSRSPDAFNEFKDEHQRIRKEKDDGEPMNGEDYKKMEFTTHVISEALRCGNVVKFVHRKAIRDVNYKGIFIPSGWKVLPVFTATHFDPLLHQNPYDFNPWRWASDKEMRKKVMPFGGGLKLCPGAELAKVVLSFFLHHLVLNYRWKIKDDDDVPIAYPYVEFRRGLVLEIHKLPLCHD